MKLDEAVREYYRDQNLPFVDGHGGEGRGAESAGLSPRAPRWSRWLWFWVGEVELDGGAVEMWKESGLLFALADPAEGRTQGAGER